jgi:membrane-associated protease RseP (regulator of RpoE activity)
MNHTPEPVALAAWREAGHLADMSNPRGSLRLSALLLGVGLGLAPGLLLDGVEPGIQGSEHSRPAYLGVTVGPVDPAVHWHLPALRGAGLTVHAVAPGSPAARAGLRRHDILLRWEDQWLYNAGQLRGLLGTLETGREQHCTILRHGTEETVELTLTARAQRTAAGPEIRVASVPFTGWQDGPALTLHLSEILQQEASLADAPTDTLLFEPEQLLGFQWRPAGDGVLAQLGLINRNGVVIETVQVEAPAGMAGLKPRDLVVALQGVAIATPEEFAERLRGYPQGSLLNFRVWRGGETLDLEMKLPPPMRSDAVRELSRVPHGDPGNVGDWIRGIGTEVEWIVLLESHSGRSNVRGTAPTSEPALPDDPFGTAPEIDSFVLPAGRGSIEVQERGGQKHYTIRDAQGSVLYEGPMSTEADRLALRPLPTAVRQAVEGFTRSDFVPMTPVEVRVWRWSLPPVDL